MINKFKTGAYTIAMRRTDMNRLQLSDLLEEDYNFKPLLQRGRPVYDV